MPCSSQTSSSFLWRPASGRTSGEQAGSSTRSTVRRYSRRAAAERRGGQRDRDQRGIGVVDTPAAAVRTAARAIQARVEYDHLRIPVRRADDEHQLLAQVASAPIDRCGAAELLLEEASAAFLGKRAEAERRQDSSRARSRRQSSRCPAPSGRGGPRRCPTPTCQPVSWPRHAGRAMLRSLALVDSIAVGPAGVVHTALDHVLTTSLDTRFVDAEAARQALVRAARERTQLDSLLVSGTVLVVQPAGDGSLGYGPSLRAPSIASWTRSIETSASSNSAQRSRTPPPSPPSWTTVLRRLEAGAQRGSVRYSGSLTNTNTAGPDALALLLGVLDEAEAIGADVTTIRGRARSPDRTTSAWRRTRSAARERAARRGGSEIAIACLLQAFARVSEAA